MASGEGAVIPGLRLKSINIRTTTKPANTAVVTPKAYVITEGPCFTGSGLTVMTRVTTLLPSVTVMTALPPDVPE